MMLSAPLAEKSPPFVLDARRSQQSARLPALEVTGGLGHRALVGGDLLGELFVGERSQLLSVRPTARDLVRCHVLKPTAKMNEMKGAHP